MQHLKEGGDKADDRSPLCMRSMGWRCIADAARLDAFSPEDMASEGLRITGMELVSDMVATNNGGIRRVA